MISSSLDFFASESGVPTAAETIFSIGSFNVTNSMIMGVIVAGLIIATFLYASAKIKIQQNGRFVFGLESVVEFVTQNLINVLGSKVVARKFLPLFATFFIFILINNLFGLLPGMGGSIYIENEGVKAALLRPVTTDLNGTLAMAIVAISSAQFFAIRERGLAGHFRHYFTIMKPWWNPINLPMGLIEVMGEFIRLLTLALRLFGVIYAGEVLIHAIAEMAGIFGPVALLPIIMLEIFFGLIQAYLFTMLSATYLSLGLAHDESHAEQPHNESQSIADSNFKQKLADAQ